MRLAILTAASLFALAACQKSADPAPAPASPGAASVATGGDSPAGFSPAQPGDAHKYEAMSKTAMSITGDLSVTPSPQAGPNLPPGATFAFAKGMALTTTLMPGGAMQGDKLYDWKTAFPLLKPGDEAKIEMYSVETELPAPPGVTGSLCDKTTFLATLLDDAGTPDPKDDTFSIAAFSSDEWPPKTPDTALCGTFSYAPAA